MAEYDSDAGDISLSNPSSSSQIFHPPRPNDVTTPTPQRLFGKNLWANPKPQSVSLNEEDEPTTPLAGSSPWSSGSARPSSAVPSSSQGLADDPQSTPTPRMPNRRTSSSGSLTRSRSLNIRVPSVDLSTSPSARGPSSATSRTPSMRLGWSRRPGEPRPPPLVNEEVCRRMQRWVTEIVVCNFDLERGPVVERRAVGRRWGVGEKENVAFSSFPDTSLFAEGSIVFSFRIRHIPPDPLTLTQSEAPSPLPERPGGPSVEQSLLNLSMAERAIASSSLPKSTSLRDMSTGEKAEEYRRWDERGRQWLYGFVWFEQRRDKGVVRGYMQKSLVILTHLPFPSLFSAVLQRIGPAFFEHGYSALEAACNSIASWPDPIPDKVLELPLMSHILNVKLPDSTETPQIGRALGVPSPQYPILASLPRSTPLRAFANFLPSLWSLWECLILAEPVLVIAPDPRTCSEIVWWLRDLVRPIPPAGDFRPYLHIHDHDFSLLINSNKPQAGVVIGVTNPVFRNAASHWPNVISISSDRPARVIKNGMSPSTSLRPPQPGGFISRRHRSVQKDRPLLKKLEALAADGKLDGACIPSECAHEADSKGNEALRAHFQQLTEKMLVPLNRYFQTLVPTLSPAPSPNPSEVTQSSGIKPFSLPAFLTHLRTHDPNPLSFRTKGLSTKARVEHDFYAAFGISATFAGWLAARVESLGLAVAAQTSNLAVPNNGAIQKSAYSSVGLGLESSLRDGQRSAAPSLSDASESDATRMSSEDDSSLSSWRANEESSRENDRPIGEDCYRRRASEGAVNLFSGAQRRTDRSG